MGVHFRNDVHPTGIGRRRRDHHAAVAPKSAPFADQHLGQRRLAVRGRDRQRLQEILTRHRSECSAGMTSRCAAETIRPTPRPLSRQCRATEAAADGIFFGRVHERRRSSGISPLESRASTRCARSQSSTIQTSDVGSVSNSLTMNRPILAVAAQLIRLKPSPGAYSRMPADAWSYERSALLGCRRARQDAGRDGKAGDVEQGGVNRYLNRIREPLHRGKRAEGIGPNPSSSGRCGPSPPPANRLDLPDDFPATADL